MGGHAPVLVCGNLYVVLTTLTSVLGKGCLHTAIWSRILFLSSYNILLVTHVSSEYFISCVLLSLTSVAGQTSYLAYVIHIL